MSPFHGDIASAMGYGFFADGSFC